VYYFCLGSDSIWKGEGHTVIPGPKKIHEQPKIKITEWFLRNAGVESQYLPSPSASDFVL
jgi:hypothetical protein